MPVRAVPSRFMYRGLCSVPDILSYRTPVNLPEDEVEEIREAFKVFDRDGNGFISKQELGMAMRSLGYMPNEVELEVIIKRLDMDAAGGESQVQKAPDEETGGTEQNQGIRMNLGGPEGERNHSSRSVSGSGIRITSVMARLVLRSL
ncbi:hypothetical protein PDJAM_G00167500 [Pangasius djambal]|uniref:Uncharacterized protein n=1 Tax=Pangasius djambal TaxID=1691987 RepID=A0ACC5ZKH3_9TELE|nr:hypothetical protein [Pangasius djambal]